MRCFFRYTAAMNNQRLDSLHARLSDNGYIADHSLLVSLDLMQMLGKPLLLEGEAGVGKTGIATSLARALDAPLIRLQCYEGLDAQQVLYDWDYQRQLLAIQMMRNSDTDSPAKTNPDASNQSEAGIQQAIYSEKYLLKRPLFKAISHDGPCILLIDEIDRADEEFEALLLEVLAENQVTVPELGTYRGNSKPHVILTSNAVRELSDALRRRCLFHYIDFPDPYKERQIVRARLPQVDEALAAQVVSLVQRLRQESLAKKPGVAETLDWLAALYALDIKDLRNSPDVIEHTLPALLKTHADQLNANQEKWLQSWLNQSTEPTDTQLTGSVDDSATWNSKPSNTASSS